MNQNELQLLLRALTGGAVPGLGQTLQFTEHGWRFKPVIVPSDTSEPAEPYTEREIVISTDPVDPAWAPDRIGSLWLQVEP